MLSKQYEQYEQYEQTNSKLYSVGVILGGFVFCLIISSLTFLCALFLMYATGHCPYGNCNTPLWADMTVFFLLASPLLVFSIGAYLCRKAVYDLTKNWFLRVVMISTFALFPLYLLIGLIVYTVNSPR